MRILLLNQTFHPDVVATAQYLTELACALVERGHQVTVVTGRRAYDDSARSFAKYEQWRGIEIYRVASAGLGKTAKWRRAVDFASFIAACCLRLITLPKPDVVVALTSPPLISFIGAWYAKLRGARFFYWVMDLNPDEAVAAGWLREGTLATRMLDRMSKFSLRHAEKVIALDRFMQARIEGKGIERARIVVIPPWSHDGTVRFDASGRDRFRAAHGLTDRFVVMYSGNHSPCHSLETLLAAARRLEDDPRFVFLFVGGGSEWRTIKETTRHRDDKTTDLGPRTSSPAVSGQRSGGPVVSGLSNVRCLPYQPLEELSGSLSAADLHVVVMGERFVGIIHPCKIYNLLNVGAPMLCIGPRPSHLTEILDVLGSDVSASVQHGEVEACVSEIRRIAERNQRGDDARYERAARTFAKEKLMEQLIRELEGESPKPK